MWGWVVGYLETGAGAGVKGALMVVKYWMAGDGDRAGDEDGSGVGADRGECGCAGEASDECPGDGAGDQERESADRAECAAGHAAHDAGTDRADDGTTAPLSTAVAVVMVVVIGAHAACSRSEGVFHGANS